MQKIEKIFTHEGSASGTLGIDKKRNLYWNEEKIVTQKVVRFRWWVNLSALFASIATIVMAAYVVIGYYMPGWIRSDCYQSVVEKLKDEKEDYKDVRFEVLYQRCLRKHGLEADGVASSINYNVNN